MRKLLLTIGCILSLALSAQSVLQVSTLSGDPYYTVPNPQGVGAVYVFAHLEDAVLQTANGQMADWFELPSNTPVATGYTAFTRAQDAHTYRVVQGLNADTFVVFDYEQYRLSPQSGASPVVTATATCESTTLSSSDMRNMTYETASGGRLTLTRDLFVTYMNLRFDSLTWVPQPVHKGLQVTTWSSIDVGDALYRNTLMTLCDSSIATVLYGHEDCLEVDSLQAIAVAIRPTSVTTTRGKSIENELERPIREDQLKGSAPMHILFNANPTPTFEYVQWEILRSQEVLSSRTEQHTRYEFTDAGSYTVTLKVGNSQCSKDTSFIITVSASMLAVPNVFTPNGDGVNDEFRVAYRSLREFNIWVYDRWGHLVYSSTDPAKGWDGTVRGRQAAEGAYYYIIRAMGTDAAHGAEYMSQHKIKKKSVEDPDSVLGIYELTGAVNLLRGKQQ